MIYAEEASVTAYLLLLWGFALLIKLVYIIIPGESNHALLYTHSPYLGSASDGHQTRALKQHDEHWKDILQIFSDQNSASREGKTLWKKGLIVARWARTATQSVTLVIVK